MHFMLAMCVCLAAKLVKPHPTIVSPTPNRDSAPCRCTHLRGEPHQPLDPLLWVAWSLLLKVVGPRK